MSQLVTASSPTHKRFNQPLTINTYNIMPPPLYLVNVIGYWQSDGSLVVYPCPLCEGIVHVAQHNSDEDISGPSIINVALAHGPKTWSIAPVPQAYANFHYVLNQFQAGSKLQPALSMLGQSSPPLLCSSNMHLSSAPSPSTSTLPSSPSLPTKPVATLSKARSTKSSTSSASSPPHQSVPSTSFIIPASSIGHSDRPASPIYMIMPSGSPQLVSIKNPPILSPENERNLLSGFLRHLPHSSKSTIKLSMPQVKPAPILSLPSNHSHTESWGTPHLLLGQPEPIVPVEVTTPSNNPITPIHSAPIEAPAHAPFPSTPPSATHRSAPMFIPSIHPRTRPETLAHKMAWGWVDTIIHFLKINRDRAQQPPTAVQQAFRSMLATVAELDEQKNLISFDVISSTGLYTVVKALANAGVRAQKARPSEQAAGVVACWERRFPGRLSDAEGGMEVDG